MNGNEILYVEDSYEDALLLKDAIRNFDMNVHIAETAEQAREKIKKYPKYCFVFVDLTLRSKFDGILLLRWIREQYPYLILVVVTGSDPMDTGKFNEILDAGAKRLLVKPFTSQMMHDLMPLREIAKENWKVGQLKGSWKTNVGGAAIILLAGYSFFKTPSALAAAVFGCGVCIFLGIERPEVRQMISDAIALIVKSKKDKE